MATTPELEERVRILESQMAKFLLEKTKPQGKDWRQTLGRFTGDELMREIDEEALRFREEDRKRAEDSES